MTQRTKTNESFVARLSVDETKRHTYRIQGEDNRSDSMGLLFAFFFLLLLLAFLMRWTNFIFIPSTL